MFSLSASLGFNSSCPKMKDGLLWAGTSKLQSSRLFLNDPRTRDHFCPFLIVEGKKIDILITHRNGRKFRFQYLYRRPCIGMQPHSAVYVPLMAAFLCNGRVESLCQRSSGIAQAASRVLVLNSTPKLLVHTQFRTRKGGKMHSEHLDGSESEDEAVCLCSDPGAIRTYHCHQSKPTQHSQAV